MRNKLRDRYDIESPAARVIKGWAEELFSTGTIIDKPRSGRPSERGNAIEGVSQHLSAYPCSSVRRVSDELNISRSTCHRIMRKDLALKPWKSTSVQFLMPDDHINRVNCCTEILNTYHRPRLSILYSFQTNVFCMRLARLQTWYFGARKIPIFGTKLCSIHQP